MLTSMSFSFGKPSLLCENAKCEFYANTLAHYTNTTQRPNTTQHTTHNTQRNTLPSRTTQQTYTDTHTLHAAQLQTQTDTRRQQRDMGRTLQETKAMPWMCTNPAWRYTAIHFSLSSFSSASLLGTSSACVPTSSTGQLKLPVRALIVCSQCSTAVRLMSCGACEQGTPPSEGNTHPPTHTTQHDTTQQTTLNTDTTHSTH